jgi:predicted TIM-barrel fold metal-dependent hydrolase
VTKSFDTLAIDTVVNLHTPEIVKMRPDWMGRFHQSKFGHEASAAPGASVEEMLSMMDAAGTERAFLVAHKTGQLGLTGSWHLPYEIVAEAVSQYPDRFHGLAGVDPTQGMAGVRALQHAINDLGFIGAHAYPHWFELAPDHARWYPFYGKCVELGVPFLTQVGQSLVYDPNRPLQSVGRPISLDAVACHFPELKLVGIHVGIPWVDEMIAMAWKHDNVFIIADAHAPKYWPESFVRYIDSYGKHKVMSGTDFPVLGFERYRREIDALAIRPQSRQLFLRDNALRVFGLKP